MGWDCIDPKGHCFWEASLVTVYYPYLGEAVENYIFFNTVFFIADIFLSHLWPFYFSLNILQFVDLVAINLICSVPEVCD